MRYILLLFVLFYSTVGYTQDNYQIHKMQAGLPSKDGWVWGKEFKVNFSIVVSDSVTVINDTPALKVRIVEQLDTRVDSTNKADKCIKYLWGAVDHNERKCFYIIAAHEKSENNSLEIYYKDICLRYYLMQD